jgi:type II secretory ATPase GspE/PulE/Tfp pilus assembly ATPase PilB-like protein
LLFRDLGISESVAETLHRIIERPQGMLLVTGPTGSGKTTTLYAALNQLRSPVVNIVTVEDPVEYQLEGVNQVLRCFTALCDFVSVRHLLPSTTELLVLRARFSS